MKPDFRVIRIIDENSILIRGGTEDGLRNGNILSILAGEDFTVKDPQTGEVLGAIKAELARVEVVNVFSRFSICMNQKTVKTNFRAIQFALGGDNDTHCELPILPDDIQGAPWKPEPRTIKVGDVLTLT
jgi:hypothetical protein